MACARYVRGGGGPRRWGVVGQRGLARFPVRRACGIVMHAGWLPRHAPPRVPHADRPSHADGPGRQARALQQGPCLLGRLQRRGVLQGYRAAHRRTLGQAEAWECQRVVLGCAGTAAPRPVWAGGCHPATLVAFLPWIAHQPASPAQQSCPGAALTCGWLKSTRLRPRTRDCRVIHPATSSRPSRLPARSRRARIELSREANW